MRPLARYLRFALILAAALLALPDAGSAQHHQPTPPAAAPKIGAAAMPFELRTLDGRAASLESFRGKPLVLNFFASWCDPCRDEMPLLNDIAAKAGDRYRLLGVAVEDTRAALSEFVKEAKVGFPVALDLNSTVKRGYRLFGPPATFFIDSQGIIRDVVFGPLTKERTDEALKKFGAPR
jgi:peroxiredoxin